MWVLIPAFKGDMLYLLSRPSRSKREEMCKFWLIYGSLIQSHVDPFLYQN